MEIHHGTYRTTLLIGPFAIKFARMIFITNFFNIFRIAKEIREVGWKYMEIEKIFTLTNLTRAWIANLTEWATFVRLRKSFLAPTYFSCGIFNISKRIKGEEIQSFEIIDGFMETLSNEDRTTIFKVSGHDFIDNSGRRKTKQGFVLVDYGDSFNSTAIPVHYVILKYQDQLQKYLDELFKETENQ
jgi:hypothetical protein